MVPDNALYVPISVFTVKVAPLSSSLLARPAGREGTVRAARLEITKIVSEPLVDAVHEGVEPQAG
jgi:hypothetical protein